MWSHCKLWLYVFLVLLCSCQRTMAPQKKTADICLWTNRNFTSCKKKIKTLTQNLCLVSAFASHSSTDSTVTWRAAIPECTAAHTPCEKLGEHLRQQLILNSCFSNFLRGIVAAAKEETGTKDLASSLSQSYFILFSQSYLQLAIFSFLSTYEYCNIVRWVGEKCTSKWKGPMTFAIFMYSCFCTPHWFLCSHNNVA